MKILIINGCHGYLETRILIINGCHSYLETKYRIINGSQELPEQNTDYKFSECSNLKMVTVSSSFTLADYPWPSTTSTPSSYPQVANNSTALVDLQVYTMTQHFILALLFTIPFTFIGPEKSKLMNVQGLQTVKLSSLMLLIF